MPQQGSGVTREDDSSVETEPWEQFPLELLSEENKVLTKQIKEQDQLQRDIDKKIEDSTERTKVLQDHFKNVQSELLHTQRLKDAKEKEIEGENHYIQLVEREIGRVRSETKKHSVLAGELSDQVRFHILQYEFKLGINRHMPYVQS